MPGYARLCVAAWAVAVTTATQANAGAPCPPPLITSAEAIRAAAQWGEWTGISPAKAIVTLELGGEKGRFFGCYYRVTSSDGKQAVTVDAYSGLPESWRDQGFVGGSTTRKLTEEERQSLSRDIVVKRCRFLDPDRVVYWRPAGWTQQLPNGALFIPNHARATLDPTSRLPYWITQSFVLPRVSAEVAPRLTERVRRQLAVDALRRVTHANSLVAWAPGPDLQTLEQTPSISQDSTGLQRLGFSYTVWYAASALTPDALAKMPPKELWQTVSSAMVNVDGQTGEAYVHPTSDPELSARAGYQRFSVAGYRFSPIYPGRLVGSVAYIYAGYLNSYLWPSAPFSLTEAEVSGVYAGHAYAARAGDKHLVVDGLAMSLQSAPKALSGRLYLPPELLEKLTGWSVRFRRASNCIEINCSAAHSGAANGPLSLLLDGLQRLLLNLSDVRWAKSCEACDCGCHSEPGVT